MNSAKNLTTPCSEFLQYAAVKKISQCYLQCTDKVKENVLCQTSSLVRERKSRKGQSFHPFPHTKEKVRSHAGEREDASGACAGEAAPLRARQRPRQSG
jgi:hypothetical protein